MRRDRSGGRGWHPMAMGGGDGPLTPTPLAVAVPAATLTEGPFWSTSHVPHQGRTMNPVWCGGKIGLALMLAGLAVSGCQQKNPGVVATPPPVVMVSLPAERTVTDYQVFTGRTQAVQSVN